MATHHEVTHHEHGSMDITEHQKTFSGFIKVLTWTVVLSLLSLVFMALVNA